MLLYVRLAEEEDQKRKAVEEAEARRKEQEEEDRKRKLRQEEDKTREEKLKKEAKAKGLELKPLVIIVSNLPQKAIFSKLIGNTSWVWRQLIRILTT